MDQKAADRDTADVTAPAQVPRMIGESACFLEMQEHISRVAPLNKSVLIAGERGTGKELIAARLHYLSPRWDAPFLKVNCAAMSESLLEAQLFGHEAGLLLVRRSCVKAISNAPMEARYSLMSWQRLRWPCKKKYSG